MRQPFARRLIPAALASAIGLGLGAAAAQHRKPYDAAVTVKVIFAPNGLRAEEVREDLVVNSDSVLQALAQLKLTNNDHFADFEILEAATIKADGHRIDVPVDRIFVMKGSVQGAALFSADTTTRVIPFADLAVGDRRVVRIRRREKAPHIQGAIEFTRVFPPARNAATIDITMDVPNGLRLFMDERGVKHTENPVPGGRRWAWRVTPAPPLAAEPLAVSPIDTAPHLFISNFKDWAAFGKNYGDLVAHAADPDATVARRAEDVTKGLTDRRAVARALFDWTSRNIRYFNVVLGSGGWLPHPPASILALRYGDCKDHATLLRAMLAAKGIASEYVVINTGRIYAGTTFPAAIFDHMIVYIPEFGLYLDPTDPTSTFESLPIGLVDKPVLRIAKSGGIADRTPINKVDETRVVLTSDVTIDADGKAAGTSIVEADGVVAEDLRRIAQAIALQGDAEVARKAFGAQHAGATATFEAPSYLDHAPKFRVASTFKLDKPFVGAKSRRQSIPTGPRLMARPSSVLNRLIDSNPTQPFACGAPRTYVEHLKVTWPIGFTLARTPPNVDLHAGMEGYRATYAVHGNTMTIDRVFRHAPVHAWCDPSELDAASDVVRAAETDYASPLLLRTASGSTEAVKPDKRARAE